MSDDARCENCGKRGRRPRFRYAPKGWLYLEAKDDEDPETAIVVMVCSRECATAMWCIGPGPRIDALATPEADAESG